MKFILPFSVAALAGLSASSPVHVKRDSPLDIQLKAVGNTAVKATITNTGTEDLKLLKLGTMLDDRPTEKVQVKNAKGRLAFNGMRLRVNTDALDDDAFTPLAAGQSITLDVEVAALHDLAEGGDFDISSAGSIPYAFANSTKLSGSAHSFKSNKLSLKVDGKLAARVAPALKPRSDVDSDCTGNELSATTTALTNCAKLASAAATAAKNGGDLFTTYFKDTSNQNTVAKRLQAVADECGSNNGGATTTSCTDSQNACSNGVLAYTLPSQNLVVNCPLYFSDLPDLSEQCHAQDQATTTLHEMTHANGVFSPGTDDLGYGFSAATSLSADEALENADSYALFANAVFTNCSSSGGGSSDDSSSGNPFGDFGGFGQGSSSAAASTPVSVPTPTGISSPGSTGGFGGGNFGGGGFSFPTPSSAPSATGDFFGGGNFGGFTLPTSLPTTGDSTNQEESSGGSTDLSSLTEILEWLKGLTGISGASASSSKHS